MFELWYGLWRNTRKSSSVFPKSNPEWFTKLTCIACVGFFFKITLTRNKCIWKDISYWLNYWCNYLYMQETYISELQLSNIYSFLLYIIMMNDRRDECHYYHSEYIYSQLSLVQTHLFFRILSVNWILHISEHSLS